MIRVYDFGELERLLTPCTRLAARLKISGDTLKHYREARWLTWEQADRLAVTAGYSPTDIWGSDFYDETAALFTRLRTELAEVDA